MSAPIAGAQRKTRSLAKNQIGCGKGKVPTGVGLSRSQKAYETERRLPSDAAGTTVGGKELQKKATKSAPLWEDRWRCERPTRRGKGNVPSTSGSSRRQGKVAQS